MASSIGGLTKFLVRKDSVPLPSRQRAGGVAGEPSLAVDPSRRYQDMLIQSDKCTVGFINPFFLPRIYCLFPAQINSDAELFTRQLRALDAARDLLERDVPGKVGAAVLGLDVRGKRREACGNSISFEPRSHPIAFTHRSRLSRRVGRGE